MDVTDGNGVGYAALGRRAQIGRLRAMAGDVLGLYGVREARLTKLRHQHNTTFRVDAAGGPYVLRISRTGTSTPDTVASEMAWLAALREETDLGVPDPVRTRDGALVVEATSPGVPGVRSCVLLRWMDGRFADRGLRPRHLERVGELMAGLQDHADRWVRPDGFLRQRVDTLTDAGKQASFGRRGDAPGAVPDQADVAHALAIVTELMGPDAPRIVGAALDIVCATTGALAGRAGSSGLVHGDLHQENYLFHGGRALAIDFDDCGWGFHLYDLEIALWELEGRDGYARLRDGLLDGYARRRALPDDVDEHLRALGLLRRVQILLWVLESRAHPAFRDEWRAWADEELLGLRQALARA